VIAHQQEKLRIVTTHLEYHSAAQRLAQAQYLGRLHGEALGRAAAPSAATDDPAYTPRFETDLTVFCGDFNFAVDAADYRSLCLPPVGLLDAWRVRHGPREHAPTCGLFDDPQWPQGPHCRDYFFVSAALAERVDEVTVNAETNASDHQPIRLVCR
jgi:endonuclease/exonuclease/phosphatase family metal-dependent hydrolase